jgi:hypothetical protein
MLTGETLLEIPEEVRGRLIRLPYDPGRFCDLGEATLLIPVARLRAKRLRPEGVLRANELMLAASECRHPRRKPLAVSMRGYDGYAIEDGNSTYANAVFSGWPSVPADIVELREVPGSEAD